MLIDQEYSEVERVAAAASGHLVGTLCVLDRVPRRLSDRQRGLLSDLAAWVELEYADLHAHQWEQQAEGARRDFVSVVSHECGPRCRPSGVRSS